VRSHMHPARPRGLVNRAPTSIAEKSYGVLNLVEAMLVFIYTRDLMYIYVDELVKHDKNQEKEEESW
jgi:hypothetical protein